LRGTLLLLAVASIAFSTNSQQADVVGDFTRSPTENIINEIDQPFVVRSVTGKMTLEPDRPDEPLADVLFEIEGPGSERKIRHATTDARGRFKIGRVPQGTYKFKATRDGFQSVMGTVTISAKAPQDAAIRIVMQVGV
jgi:Carboxypeptidase regulatory-like domain